MSIPSGPIDFDRLRHDNVASIVLDDEVLTLRAHSTQEWLAALTSLRIGRVFPGFLDDDDQVYIWRRLMDEDDGFDVTQTTLIARSLVTEVCAMPWYGALRLAALTAEHWVALESAARLKGVDLLRVPVRAALGCVWSMAREGMTEEKKIAEFDAELWSPIVDGEDGQTRAKWTPQQQASSFSAFRMARAGHG